MFVCQDISEQASHYSRLRPADVERSCLATPTLQVARHLNEENRFTAEGPNNTGVLRAVQIPPGTTTVACSSLKAKRTAPGAQMP